MYLWPFTNLIFTDDTASTDQHHAIYRWIQKKWGGGCNTPHTPPIATPLSIILKYKDFKKIPVKGFEAYQIHLL